MITIEAYKVAIESLNHVQARVDEQKKMLYWEVIDTLEDKLEKKRIHPCSKVLFDGEVIMYNGFDVDKFGNIVIEQYKKDKANIVGIDKVSRFVEEAELYLTVDKEGVVEDSRTFTFNNGTYVAVNRNNGEYECELGSRAYFSGTLQIKNNVVVGYEFADGKKECPIEVLIACEKLGLKIANNIEK